MTNELVVSDEELIKLGSEYQLKIYLQSKGIPFFGIVDLQPRKLVSSITRRYCEKSKLTTWKWETK